MCYQRPLGRLQAQLANINYNFILKYHYKQVLIKKSKLQHKVVHNGLFTKPTSCLKNQTNKHKHASHYKTMFMYLQGPNLT